MKNGQCAACLKYSVCIFVEYIYKMQHLEVSGAVRHIYIYICIYIYVIRRLKVNDVSVKKMNCFSDSATRSVPVASKS